MDATRRSLLVNLAGGIPLLAPKGYVSKVVGAYELNNF